MERMEDEKEHSFSKECCASMIFLDDVEERGLEDMNDVHLYLLVKLAEAKTARKQAREEGDFIRAADFSTVIKELEKMECLVERGEKET